DNLNLNKYKQTIDDNSATVELLTPSKTAHPYFAEFGWLSTDKNLILPSSNTVWMVEGNASLTPETPITLVWYNGQGVKFINQISVDKNYLFTLKQSVENNTGHEIPVYTYGLVSKQLNPAATDRSVVHTGVTGIFDDKLKEISYNKIKEDGETFETTGGWVSFSDKYWFGSFIFNDSAQNKISIKEVKEDTYQLDYKGLPLQIQSGSAASVTTQMYAGAKEIRLLDNYAKQIKKFDLNVDFGWYYFLTKPFYYILTYLYGLIGNMGWAILLFAALLRIAMFPIANKSYESMSKMKKVQPKLMVLQEMYKDDKLALQRATMELYKKEKINPAAGCLPMFIQIPIFFSLYKVLNIALEIRHAPFIGWVKDLSAPDPLTLSVWTHIPYIPSALDIGIWPLIYGFTMILQNKLNPKPANKDQARMMMLMPIIFTIMFAHFAVGLVIYWLLSNIFSLAQQKIIMYKNGVK
ncbi:MAG: membrane protein insertase YidC, partial [Alphaproteobacteria bacterium]|nr:membrane protein insertase YidC [Alphaproteobacteria bacterium]